MALEYLNDTLTHDQYMQKRKTRSVDSWYVVRSTLRNLELFLEDSWSKEITTVLGDLKRDYDETKSFAKTLVMLQHFVNWMAEDHPHLKVAANHTGTLKPWTPKCESTINNYLAQLRKYLVNVTGIQIPAEILYDRIEIPYNEDEEKEEAEPLLPTELRRIIDNQGSVRRQMMYRIMKDTCSRIRAMCGLKKKNFNTTVRPIQVTFPARIMKKKKGKSVTVTKFVSSENEDDIIALLEKYDDDDLVFVNNSDLRLAAKNEGTRWNTLVKKLGFTEVYEHNGHLKKNIHSIKAFTETAAEDAVDEAYANAYGDHKRYLPQYIRWSLEKKVSKFKAMEPLIALYQKVEVKHDSVELYKENIEIKSKFANYDALIAKLTEELHDIKMSKKI